MENERGQFNDDCKECIHHWLLDERNFGVCKKCGAQKQFPIEVFGWQSRRILIGKTSHSAAH
jgi:hypothetical protein